MKDKNKLTTSKIILIIFVLILIFSFFLIFSNSEEKEKPTLKLGETINYLSTNNLNTTQAINEKSSFKEDLSSENKESKEEDKQEEDKQEINAICQCDNDLDCPDFETQEEAQECYDYCMDIKGTDFHRLDRDKDEFACEVN